MIGGNAMRAIIATTLTAAATLASPAGRQTPGPARPVINGVAHATIQVTDLAKARAFYGRLLGLREAAAADRAHSAVFVVNPRQRVILKDGLPADRDDRFVDLAFATDDLAALRAWLQAHGMSPSEPVADTTAGGRRSDVRDPDGHVVQIVQLDPPAAATPRTAGADAPLSTRILHAGLTIKDAAASDRFYKDALGFSEIWRGGRPEGTINWINMRVPDGTEYLEYMLYPAAPPTRRQLGSAHHIALLVTDIQQALDTVRSRTSVDDPNHRATPNIGVNNRWQLNLFDADGTRVELMEPWTVR